MNLLVVIIGAASALLGASVASFVNVVVDRIPQGRSPISPPSACDGCGRQLRAVENIPVASWLIQRGRCRSCDAHIPRRVVIVEMAGAAIGLTIAMIGVIALISGS
jgi:leader peptidase (prepilin peptidase) / N-methyltransferase